MASDRYQRTAESHVASFHTRGAFAQIRLFFGICRRQVDVPLEGDPRRPKTNYLIANVESFNVVKIKTLESQDGNARHLPIVNRLSLRNKCGVFNK